MPPSAMQRQYRNIGLAVLTALAISFATWFFGFFIPASIFSAHADEHTLDLEQLTAVQSIAASNAMYINNQILAALYLRAGRLRENLQRDPNDGNARTALAGAEVEIRRREAQLAQPP